MTKRLISILMAFTLLAAMVLSLSSCGCKHEWETVPGVATCWDDGHSEYQRCNKCGETEGYRAIPPTGVHTSSGAATCTTAEKCTVCNKTIKSSLGHSFEGTTDGTCIRCDFGVRFILPTTPKTIYDTSGYDSTCIIESIKIERKQESIYSTPTYELTFMVQSIYHEKGNNYSDDARFGWKLYDEDGIVVTSGTGRTDASIKVGEKSKETLTFRVGADKSVQDGKTFRFELLNIS